jgi:hypothetical protein
LEEEDIPAVAGAVDVTVEAHVTGAAEALDEERASTTPHVRALDVAGSRRASGTGRML